MSTARRHIADRVAYLTTEAGTELVGLFIGLGTLWYGVVLLGWGGGTFASSRAWAVLASYDLDERAWGGIATLCALALLVGIFASITALRLLGHFATGVHWLLVGGSYIASYWRAPLLGFVLLAGVACFLIAARVAVEHGDHLGRRMRERAEKSRWMRRS